MQYFVAAPKVMQLEDHSSQQTSYHPLEKLWCFLEVFHTEPICLGTHLYTISIKSLEPLVPLGSSPFNPAPTSTPISSLLGTPGGNFSLM